MADLNKAFNFFNQFLEQAKEAIIEIFGFWHIRIYLFFIFLANFFIWLVGSKIKKDSFDELIALHYNVDSGVNLIGRVEEINIIPFLGLIIIIINFSLILFLYKYQNIKFASHLLLLTALFANIILLAGAISLYFVNHRFF